MICQNIYDRCLSGAITSSNKYNQCSSTSSSSGGGKNEIRGISLPLPSAIRFRDVLGLKEQINTYGPSNNLSPSDLMDQLYHIIELADEKVYTMYDILYLQYMIYSTYKI